MRVGFGGYALNSEDGLTSYSIGGYPDCLDDYHIIYFTTKDNKYGFGFSIGDSIEKQRRYTIGERIPCSRGIWIMGKL